MQVCVFQGQNGLKIWIQLESVFMWIIFYLSQQCVIHIETNISIDAYDWH